MRTPIHHEPMVEQNRKGLMYRTIGKRVFDLVVAGAASLACLPVVIVTAAAVYVKLGRPVIFSQERAGKNGCPFVLYKFRTMTDEVGADGNLLPDDERLHRFGRLLRSTSIDELPALINVILGDMSTVGPRPLYTFYTDRYNPRQRRRLEVKPGITGWAQINGRNAVSWKKRFELDVWYVDHVSFTLDLRILASTLWKVLRREGISQPGHATMEVFQGDT